jgi:ribA/ribD-fused uncharacterized protein
MKIKNRLLRNRINALSYKLVKRWLAFPPVPVDGKILFFRRDRNDFGFLSNFYPSPFVLDGFSWPHVEAFYQVQKSDNWLYREYVLKKNSPVWAKHAGDSHIGDCRIAKKSWFRKHPEDLKPNWDQIKIQEMQRAVREKFYQNNHLQRALLQTRDLTLIEDSEKDAFWGWGKAGEGENTLGKILMDVRKELVDLSRAGNSI